MGTLDRYLAAHFLNEAQLMAAADISADELATLVGQGLVPAPSYVVSEQGKVTSYVFGEMDAGGAIPGRYFHPSQTVWIARAREALAVDGVQPQQHLQAVFTARFGAALADLNASTCRMPDSFDASGKPIASGLAVRLESAWLHFQKGTFGLCVAAPVSEAHIARKEVLQEKLTQLSENGSRSAYSPSEAAALRALIEAYATAAMPFSPVEYPISSRKRLVEDLLKKMRHVEQAEQVEQGVVVR